MRRSTHRNSFSIMDFPDFFPVVKPYLRDRDRAHLAFILRVWSPAIDPGEHHIADKPHAAPCKLRIGPYTHGDRLCIW